MNIEKHIQIQQAIQTFLKQEPTKIGKLSIVTIEDYRCWYTLINGEPDGFALGTNHHNPLFEKQVHTDCNQSDALKLMQIMKRNVHNYTGLIWDQELDGVRLTAFVPPTMSAKSVAVRIEAIRKLASIEWPHMPDTCKSTTKESNIV